MGKPRTLYVFLLIAGVLGSLYYFHEDAVSKGYPNYCAYKRSVAAGFSTKAEENEAFNFGVDTKVKYDAAKRGGFTSGLEWTKANEKGFENVKDYKEATSLGYEDAAAYKDGIQRGYSNASEASAGKAGGFANANEYRIAVNRGVKTRTVLLNLIDGNKMIARCADGTTYSRHMCDQKEVGQRFYFKGKIIDVYSEYKAVIKIFSEKGNNANVIFRDPVMSSFSKEQPIYFWGTLTDLGTGVMIRHDIGDAVIDNVGIK